MDQLTLEKYGRLVVRTGVNIKKGQILVLSSPIECAYFARIVQQEAYDAGARDVVMVWNDELTTKIRYMSADEGVFNTYPSWMQELYLSNVRQDCAFISIYAEDPEILKEVPPQRVAAAQKARGLALKEYYHRTMSNRNTWCVVSVPTPSWARKVFEGVSEEEAMASLWQAIIKSVRVDQEDPVGAWEEHKGNLRKRLEFLNGHRFRYLKYRNSLGTDLTVELPEGHLWLGGSDFTPEGHPFIANMPTEEVYTLPKRSGVNGTVYASMPLHYNGNLIQDFSLTFKDGKIVEYRAREGESLLKSLIETDEGASYLGEVALVPYDSPIRNTGILFYNTLFDENAACHLAIGRAYPVCIQGGDSMSPEQLQAAGVNDSLTHEDFMVGTQDLSIVGVKDDGTEIPVFVNGNFA